MTVENFEVSLITVPVQLVVKTKLVPVAGACYSDIEMRIISKKTLREFWSKHPDAEQSLQAWHAKTKLAVWKTSSDVKDDYRNASFVANNRVIFNIKGNTYRLVGVINYDFSIVYIRFIGTHKDYDNIDATVI